MKKMDEAGALSQRLPSQSHWTCGEALRVCRAVMHGAVAASAAQAAVRTQSVERVRRFILRMHGIISTLVRPCGVCIPCDEAFPAVLVAWFEACVDIGMCPLFAPRGAARDSLRDVMAAAVVASRGCHDARALAQRANTAYAATRVMIAAHTAAGPAAPRLTAREFLGGLLTLPREEREALAAQLLAEP